MIIYNTGTWGIGFIFRCHGSVFPKAACWALPNAAIAFLLHYFFYEEDSTKLHLMSGVNMLFASWSGVLGFLVVFRNNLSHERFWEGATLISQVRGNWFNAVSNLIAFCSKDPKKHERVSNFQHLLVRLSSLLYCAALQQICDLRDDTLEIIDPRGMSTESLDYLQSSNDRCEVILQWIQQLIVDANRSTVLDIAPPILSRVFQELSNGVVGLSDVRKIREIPFPFAYSQMITCMFLLQYLVTPVFASYTIHNGAWAAIMCFLYTGAYASLLYIPLEIEQPFGSDANDLPLYAMQRDYNESLMHLLDPLMQHPPSWRPEKDQEMIVVESGYGLSSRIEKRRRSTGSIRSSLSRAASWASLDSVGSSRKVPGQEEIGNQGNVKRQLSFEPQQSGRTDHVKNLQREATFSQPKAVISKESEVHSSKRPDNVEINMSHDEPNSSTHKTAEGFREAAGKSAEEPQAKFLKNNVYLAAAEESIRDGELLAGIINEDQYSMPKQCGFSTYVQSAVSKQDRGMAGGKTTMQNLQDSPSTEQQKDNHMQNGVDGTPTLCASVLTPRNMPWRMPSALKPLGESFPLTPLSTPRCTKDSDDAINRGAASVATMRRTGEAASSESGSVSPDNLEYCTFQETV